MAILRQYVSFLNLPKSTNRPNAHDTMIDNQAKLQNRFQAVMLKLSTLGHNTDDMVDCSDVIPIPPPFTGQATFPAGLSHADVEQAVRNSLRLNQAVY